MEEQQLPSVTEKKRVKYIFIIAAVFLLVAAAVVTAIVLWPEEKSVAPPRYTAEEPFDPDTVDWFLDLSPEVLETVSLEAVREYMPTAASFTAIRRDGGYDGDYAVMDANGAEIGLVILDSSGKISSGRIYSIGFEKAKDLAVGIIADKGIDPELLLLEEANIQHASEHVTEYQFRYVPHIGDVPVHNQDNCSIWLNPMDGSIMTFYLNGSFVLPDITPTETLISKEEAISLAVEEFSKAVNEEYPISYSQESLEGISYILAEPVTFVYNQMENSIAPCWRIPLERFVKMAGDDGDAISVNGSGGSLYEVNATTGEVLDKERW